MTVGGWLYALVELERWNHKSAQLIVDLENAGFENHEGPWVPGAGPWVPGTSCPHPLRAMALITNHQLLLGKRARGLWVPY